MVDATSGTGNALAGSGPTPRLTLIRRTKHQTSPSHRFGAGRLVGGI